MDNTYSESENWHAERQDISNVMGGKARKGMNRIEEVAQLLAMKHPYGYDDSGKAVNWYGLSEQEQAEAIKDAKQIDQLYEPQPESPMYLDSKGQWQDKPDQSGLLTQNEINAAQAEWIKQRKRPCGADKEWNEQILAAQDTKTASIKDARYRQAVKDDHVGKPLDLTDDEFEIYSAIQSAATVKAQARIEALIKEIEDTWPRRDMVGGPIASADIAKWWYKLKGTYRKGEEVNNDTKQ